MPTNRKPHLTKSCGGWMVRFKREESDECSFRSYSYCAFGATPLAALHELSKLPGISFGKPAEVPDFRPRRMPLID